MPTMQMFMSSAETSACAKATSTCTPSWPGPSASADTLVTLTAVPSMVCGRENLLWGGAGRQEAALLGQQAKAATQQCSTSCAGIRTRNRTARWLPNRPLPRGTPEQRI